jgi:LppP/LprE lipoprotein
VWTAARGQRRLLDTLTGAPAAVADASAFPPAVVAVSVHGDEVLVTFTSYGDDDPHCCPSQQTEVRYQLDGGDLEPVGRPRTGPAES